MRGKLALIRKKNGIGNVTINRPHVMNAVTIELMSTLIDAFEEIASDENIRVIVLEGEGENFSTGADMALLQRDIDSSQWLEWMEDPIGKLILTMRTIPQPVICKVRGNVIGYGVGLALAGDFVVASHDTRFREVFVNLGVTLDGGASYFLPRLVGMAKAKEIALLGEVIDGRTAASIGLIYKSVPEEELDHVVESLAGVLSKKSIKSMSTIKKNLEKSVNMTLEEALAWEAFHQAILLTGNELKESVNRFSNSHKKV